jgi:ABC-2 type transport system permease protein
VTFSAIGAVAAQLTTGSRAANGVGIATVGGAYLLRALGDLPDRGPTLLTWLSPIGWSQQIRPFAGDRFAVVGLPIVASVGLTVAALTLRNRRDLGAGMWSERPGPAVGAMHSTWALTLRLNRNLWIGWAVGTALFGALIGSLTTNVSGLVNSPGMQDLIEAMGGTQTITDAFLSTELSVLGSIIAAFGVTSITHLRSEETAGRAEILLAGPLDRRRWVGGHLAAALLGVAALMLVAGVAVGLGYSVDAGGASRLGEIVGAAAVRIPAAWVFVGLGLAVFGWVPQRTRLVWVAFVVAALILEFGPLLKLPQWLVDISPFAHSPKLPGAEVVLVPVLVLTALAAAAAAVGWFGFARRDVTA